jgi:hypothetical protein
MVQTEWASVSGDVKASIRAFRTGRVINAKVGDNTDEVLVSLLKDDNGIHGADHYRLVRLTDFCTASRVSPSV